MKGIKVAYEIFSWEKVTLSIQDTCAVESKQIHDDLQAILMEAMRRKDENENPPTISASETMADSASELEHSEPADDSIEKEITRPPVVSKAEALQQKLKHLSAERRCLENIFHDDRWDNLLRKLAETGTFFESGRLKLGYLSCNEETDFIVLPSDRTMVISIRRIAPATG